MKIKSILNRHRRDFTAVYVCGYCGYEHEGRGYDDEYFHTEVIPSMVCKECSKKGEPDYVPMDTKYAKGELV